MLWRRVLSCFFRRSEASEKLVPSSPVVMREAMRFSRALLWSTVRPDWRMKALRSYTS